MSGAGDPAAAIGDDMQNGMGCVILVIKVHDKKMKRITYETETGRLRLPPGRTS